MVGALYEQGDRRRDAGFTIFYMGINLGSILGQFFCPILADTLGWWAGFSLAGVGMLVSYLLIQFDGGRLAGYGETPQREGGFNTIAERISRFPEVRSAYLMSGSYDLLLFVEGRNLREVAAFVSERLSPLEGVLSTSTHFMLKTYKRFGVLMESGHAEERLSVAP